jgi:perosamine synthetase
MDPGPRLQRVAAHLVQSIGCGGGGAGGDDASGGPSDYRQLRMGTKEREYVMDVIDNEFRTSHNSKYNSRLETDFAARWSTPGEPPLYGIGHNNGTCTMHTALWAAGLRDGDEVVVPPLTMSATAICCLHNRCIPVFADVDPETFNISAAGLEAVITPRTKAVITVALYGLCPDYDSICALCKKHGLVLIEDNAECFLGEYKGKLVGSIGDYASFSFQASKHMTAGEGGMLLVKDQERADAARRFCCLGYGSTSATKQKFSKQEIQSPDYNRHVQLGWNYRMSELQAAVACAQLEQLDGLVAMRVRAARAFDGAIAGFSFLQRQAEPAGFGHSWWCYSLILHTDDPAEDWFKFRQLWLDNGGDDVVGACLPACLSACLPALRRRVKYFGPTRSLKLWHGFWLGAAVRVLEAEL